MQNINETLKLLNPKKKEEEKLHYILVAGTIITEYEENNEVHITGVNCNAVVATADGRIPLRLIGRAQQNLQLSFRQKCPDTDIKIKDVIILSMTHLGKFTIEEFNARPEQEATQS